ncbi:unnamed protein product [Clavelina lepadiformis]|uniref:Uncharacterized protein n=1 Tax=Clavelina lepadiformis TaxID=159417 RepID=A0ABP0FUP7_CLALP
MNLQTLLIAGLPQVSVFIRYIYSAALSEEYSIPWNKCAGICIDGAAAYTAFKSGVAKRIKDKAPSVE